MESIQQTVNIKATKTGENKRMKINILRRHDNAISLFVYKINRTTTARKTHEKEDDIWSAITTPATPQHQFQLNAA